VIVASDDMRIVRSASAIDLRRIAPYLAGAAVFVLFSTPSIKLYLYTEAINAVPLVLFAGSLLMNPPGRVSRARLSGLMLGMMLFAVLFFFGAYNSASLDLVLVVKYAILCILCVGACLATDRRALGVAALLIAVWGSVLAVVQLSQGITLDRSLGLNYLTLGYALGSSTLIGLIAASAARSLPTKLAGLACALASLAAAGTLLGRGPILFPLATFLGYLAANTVLAPSLRKVAARLIVAFAAVAAVIYYFGALAQAEGMLRRLSRLSNLADEPRVAGDYLPALSAIAEQPLGIGLEAHQRVLGAYPHNIFLELFISGGALAVLLFLLLTGWFLRRFGAIARDRVDLGAKCMFLLTVYYFLVWNISFDLASAYALLPMMIFFAALSGSEFAKVSCDLWSAEKIVIKDRA
jgi:hypothetical protein